MSERAVEKHVGSVFTKLGILHESDVNRRVMAVLAFLEATGGPRCGVRVGQPPPVGRTAPCRRDARKGHDVGQEVLMSEVRVLVVDDQLAYRRALAAVVTETDGFAMVGSTTSGEESLVIAAEVLPDLVLMDVNLPGISGIDAARRLTAAPGGPVVVLLSTYDEDEFDLAGCGACGVRRQGHVRPGPALRALVRRHRLGRRAGDLRPAGCGAPSRRGRVFTDPPNASARSTMAWRSSPSSRRTPRTTTSTSSARERELDGGQLGELAHRADAARVDGCLHRLRRTAGRPRRGARGRAPGRIRCGPGRIGARARCPARASWVGEQAAGQLPQGVQRRVGAGDQLVEPRLRLPGSDGSPGPGDAVRGRSSGAAGPRGRWPPPWPVARHRRPR